MPWYGYVAAVVIAVVLIWIIGDLLYALVMRLWYARWEKGIERDAEGVRAGCREGSYGEGDTALLLIHGFGDSPAVWQRMGPALAARGFAVRTLRLPGHGLPMAQYRRTDSVQWRQSVQQALTELRPRHGRVVAVSLSLGGAVLIDALADRQGLADGIVLMAPLIDVSRRRSPLLHPRTWYLILDHTLLFTDFVAMVLPPHVHDKQAVSLMCDDLFVPRIVYRELFAVIARNRGRAPTFRLPLLMLLSRDDRVVDNAAAERFFADYGGAPKRLQIMPEPGHVMPIDFGWEKMVEEVARFAVEDVKPREAVKAG